MFIITCNASVTIINLYLQCMSRAIIIKSCNEVATEQPFSSSNVHYLAFSNKLVVSS